MHCWVPQLRCGRIYSDMVSWKTRLSVDIYVLVLYMVDPVDLAGLAEGLCHFVPMLVFIFMLSGTAEAMYMA